MRYYQVMIGGWNTVVITNATLEEMGEHYGESLIGECDQFGNLITPYVSPALSKALKEEAERVGNYTNGLAAIVDAMSDVKVHRSIDAYERPKEFVTSKDIGLGSMPTHREVSPTGEVTLTFKAGDGYTSIRSGNGECSIISIPEKGIELMRGIKGVNFKGSNEQAKHFDEWRAANPDRSVNDYLADSFAEIILKAMTKTKLADIVTVHHPTVAKMLSKVTPTRWLTTQWAAWIRANAHATLGDLIEALESDAALAIPFTTPILSEEQQDHINDLVALVLSVSSGCVKADFVNSAYSETDLYAYLNEKRTPPTDAKELRKLALQPLSRLPETIARAGTACAEREMARMQQFGTARTYAKKLIAQYVVDGTRPEQIRIDTAERGTYGFLFRNNATEEFKRIFTIRFKNGNWLIED